MKDPVGCILWSEPERILEGPVNRFDVVEEYVDESHLGRSLLKCRECGQLYFFEFYKEIDWSGGNDPQYCTYIPVTTREEIEELRKTDRWGILTFAPRLQKDWPCDADKPKAYWIRRKD